MAETIKIQKIKVAGKAIYPATILDAVKDATAKITVDGVEKDNPSFGKTLREIIVDNEKVTASALTELDSRAGKLADLSTTEKGSLVGAINEVASSASGATGDLTTLTTDAKTSAVAAINELDAAIDTLNGDANTEGSVDAKIAAVKKEILTGDSTETINEAYDTLLEVGKWITDDESGAAALSAQVGKNTTAIGEKAVAGSDAVLYTYEEYVALEGKEDTTQEEFEALNVLDKTKTPAQLGSEATGLYKEIEDAIDAASHAKTTVVTGTANGTISVDGGADVTIYAPVTAAPSSTATDAQLATAKGVYDYALTAEAVTDTTEYADVF